MCIRDRFLCIRPRIHGAFPGFLIHNRDRFLHRIRLKEIRQAVLAPLVLIAQLLFFLQHIIPVSYTHLDVYKRQVYFVTHALVSCQMRLLPMLAF